MALAPGTRFGPYEILAPLGAGGMGEVYRARDTRLDRAVAIKVLPEEVSGIPEARERFEREARAVSALNHPNICTLHDIGSQDGTDFLVMEMIEGESLADRLEKGALPGGEALRIAGSIASALARAHEAGVVHRDLKPGNIMLTKSGPKLLDFGLAKLMQPDAAAVDSSLSALPTERKPLTAEGSIMGTFQYMAPEQLEGREADARTDIFAFGAVLYEMLTGSRAFQGASKASLIAAIMEKDPRPVSAVQPLSPPALDRILATCLAKDPDERWQSARDLELQIRWVAEEDPSAAGAGAAERTRSHRLGLLLAWGIAVVATIAAAASLAGRLSGERAEGPVMRLSIQPPAEVSKITYIALSPDGKRIAFSAQDVSGASYLWIRSFDDLVPKRLDGTAGASSPFWSPDGESIGYFAEGNLQRIAAAGGRPEVICAAPASSGGSWGRDDLILFKAGNEPGLQIVSADGGEPRVLTHPEPPENNHIWPWFLPDGKRFLFLGDSPETEGHSIRSGSVDSGSTEALFHAISSVTYAEPGYVLYTRGGALEAVPFDLETMEVKGQPVRLTGRLGGTSGRLGGNSGHYFQFSVSSSGVLTYVTGPETQKLIWYDRGGREIGSAGPPGRFAAIALSPDGKTIAYEEVDQERRAGELWLVDRARDVTSRFTFTPDWERTPIFSRDGRWVYFVVRADFERTLVRKRTSGAGEVETLAETGQVAWLGDTSPDGRYVVYQNFDPMDRTGNDIYLLDLDGERQVRPLVASSFEEVSAAISPDGKWLAYASDETGSRAIYVQRFPELGGKVRVSPQGGDHPQWRGDGRELFYIDSESSLVAVPVETGQQFEAGEPASLFKPRIFNPNEGVPFRVTADGTKFLVMSVPEAEDRAPITTVVNWTADLK